jgi:hypothetical protein
VVSTTTSRPWVLDQVEVWEARPELQNAAEFVPSPAPAKTSTTSRTLQLKSSRELVVLPRWTGHRQMREMAHSR